MIEHVDDTGAPCARHPAPELERLLSLATIGSRASGFHHDLASKLQGIMMALDEVGEGTTQLPEVALAAASASAALKELNALLNANRALTKPPVRERVALRELIARASERVYVKLAVEIPEVTVEVARPAAIHGLALLFDVAGGPGRGRALAGSIEVADGHVTLRLDASPSPPPNASESLVLATFVIARDHGAVCCAAGGAQLVVRLPVAS